MVANLFAGSTVPNSGLGTSSVQPASGTGQKVQSFRTYPVVNTNLALYQLQIRDPNGAVVDSYTFPLSPESVRKEFDALTNVYDVQGDQTNNGVQRIVDVYGHCYADDTEVLTDTGWKLFRDVTKADKLATRNMSSKEFEWQNPTHLWQRYYSGEMFWFNSAFVDLLVSPDHRMLLDKLPSMCNDGIKRNREQGGDVLWPAKKLRDFPKCPSGCSNGFGVPTSSVWKGTPIKEVRFEEPATKCPFKPVVMSGDDFCALMGAFIAEGNMRVQGGIEINQRTYSPGYAEYSELITRIVGVPGYNGKAFVIGRRSLDRYFSQFGPSYIKFVPQEIMDATPEQIRIFLHFYNLGDGEVRSSWEAGSDQMYIGTRYTTTSKKLADQLMELVQKVGLYATVSKETEAGEELVVGRICKVRDSYRIATHKRSRQAFKLDIKNYSGYIVCATVPNGTLYVRRNGKPSWCGNSPVTYLIEGTTGWKFHSLDGFQFNGLQSIKRIEQFLSNFAQLNQIQIANGNPNLYQLWFFDYFRNEFWWVVPMGRQGVRQSVARTLMVSYAFRLEGIADLGAPPTPNADPLSTTLSQSNAQASQSFTNFAAAVASDYQGDTAAAS